MLRYILIPVASFFVIKTVFSLCFKTHKKKDESYVFDNKSNIRALCCGLNYSGQNRLDGCINDTIHISKELKERYPDVNLCIMTDERGSKIIPTQKNILNKIDLLVKDLPEDKETLIIFQYAGHGVYKRDKNNDELDGKDECLYTADEKLITDDVLFDHLIKPIITNSLVTLICIMDCCHSGTILDLPYIYNTETNSWDSASKNQNKDIQANIIALSGCKDYQTSADAFLDNTPQGAMTYCFRSAINSGNTNLKDILIDIRKTLEQTGFDQIPQLSSSKKCDITQNLFPIF